MRGPTMSSTSPAAAITPWRRACPGSEPWPSSGRISDESARGREPRVRGAGRERRGGGGRRVRARLRPPPRRLRRGQGRTPGGGAEHRAERARALPSGGSVRWRPGEAGPPPHRPRGEGPACRREDGDGRRDPRHGGRASGRPQRGRAAAPPPAGGREPREGLNGAARLLLSPSATVGVRTYLSEPLALEPPRPGFVERIDHLGVASADNGAAVEAFVRRLGCPLESTQTDIEVRIAVESFTSDRYGVAYHARPPQPAGGARGACVTVGDCEL